MKYELIFKTYYFILKIEIFTRKFSLKKRNLKILIRLFSKSLKMIAKKDVKKRG